MAAYALTNPNADETTKSVYKYLCSRNGETTLSAQQESTWMGSADYEMDYIFAHTGKLPAMRGLDYMHDDFAGVNKRAAQWWQQGGLVTICWHTGADFTGEWKDCMESEIGDWDAVLTPGTAENEAFLAGMDKAGRALLELQEQGVTVLWRPFHEFDGKWFWWGAKDAATFKTLWIEMFNELKEAGLDNLIWVWTSCGKDDDWYPGDAYVDIVARDLYGDKAETCASEFATLGSTYGNKIVTLGECGYSTSTKKQIATLSEQNEKGAKWSWFMVWYNDEKKKTFHSTQEWWQNAMSQPNIITRDQVPSIK